MNRYSKELGWPLEYAQFLFQAEQYVYAGLEERWWGNAENFCGQTVLT
jgi:hypothetical protein